MIDNQKLFPFFFFSVTNIHPAHPTNPRTNVFGWYYSVKDNRENNMQQQNDPLFTSKNLVNFSAQVLIFKIIYKPNLFHFRILAQGWMNKNLSRERKKKAIAIKIQEFSLITGNLLSEQFITKTLVLEKKNQSWKELWNPIWRLRS